MVIIANARSDDARYRALRAHDRRFDGVFFVGVSSTGIYCRPVCRVRLPKREHCTFFETAAAAEGAGYRPCLRCRPERAPGRSLTDATHRLATVAFERISAGALNAVPMATLASDLCVSERQLRRAVKRAFGVSPVQLAQTRRLLLAKQLLAETTLPVTRVAFAAGFSSVSRFNTLFRSRYGLNPTALRRAGSDRAPAGVILLRLEYRPPLDWPALLGFLGGRATPGVERVHGDAYVRTVAIDGATGLIDVRHAPGDAPALELRVSDSLGPVLMPLLAAVRRLFDLDAEPEAIARVLSRDKRLAASVRARPGLRVPGALDGFELAFRAVLGQQVSVRAATTLAGRLTAAFGEPAPADVLDAERNGGRLDRLPVTADRLAAVSPDEIAAVGMPLTRARTLVELARAVAREALDLRAGADPDASISRLFALPGIGPWTAQYIAMRALHWPDAFPATDLVIRRVLGDDAVRTSEPWRPWRAYAAMHLWAGPTTNGGND
ncbi:MAG TPA: AlkA N-terminal domain-containing protein [Longimicrobiales bacterium]|nr:AlkA N-terminal domain-containing protein [Longimicrobiales bacterium]